ncbi:hypothetical protein D3C87_1343550 [compost metagenome]
MVGIVLISIGIEMKQLKEKLSKNCTNDKNENPMELLFKLKQEVAELTQKSIKFNNRVEQENLIEITKMLDIIREML